MSLRSDIEKARELDAKIKESARDPRVQTGHAMDLYAHYRTLVPRLIEQMEAMEGALVRVNGRATLVLEELDEMNGSGVETPEKLDVARGMLKAELEELEFALAALDKE